MLLALKTDKLEKATPGANAICPHCRGQVAPRCGSIRTWHWAHKVGECIYHTEPETEWHLEWKDRALKLGFEIEKRFGEHIADIYDPKTNTVIEVQHSPISEEDIIDRCFYYSDLCMNVKWILDKIQKNISLTNVIDINDISIDEIIQFSKVVNFREKYPNKSFRCLFDQQGYPIHDITFHVEYHENDPVVLKIHRLYDNKDYRGFGKLYIFEKTPECHDRELKEYKLVDNMCKCREEIHERITKIGQLNKEIGILDYNITKIESQILELQQSSL